MPLSDTFWKIVRALYARGHARLAAGIANAICRDRNFSIDSDGDWVNSQAGMTFYSPYVFAARLDYIKEFTRDYWFFDRAPAAGEVAFDIGAGIGEECAILAQTGARVFAIEAQPDIHRCLVKTIKANKLDNITPILCAIGASNGTIAITMAKNSIANTVIDADIGSAMVGEKVDVPLKTLESLAQELGISRVDFLKMNIEGAERDAVKGIGSLPIGHAVISCHDFFGMDEFRTKEDVSKEMTARGFSIRTRPDADNICLRDYLYCTAG